MSLQEAKQFVAQFVKGDYTPEEYATFLRWLRGATVNELNEIADEHEALHEHWDISGLVPSLEWKTRMEEKLDGVHDDVNDDVETPVRVIGENRFGSRKIWIAAASVVVLLASGTFLYMQNGGMKGVMSRPELPATAKTAVNPSGGVEEKQVVLADGSKVLLNVASTLKYPEAFGEGDRVVELSGEAYFEVVPNASKPFRVLIKDAEVDVLGTNFNIRAYADEPESKTTLIGGSVKMETRSDKTTLEPGQQAVIGYPSTGVVVHNVDVNAVMAWKNGDYIFTNEEFQSVARVLSRYYNVEIQCDEKAAVFKVSASVSRGKGLKENLDQFTSLGFKYDLHAKPIKVTL
jgi:ferric-dicitrate binding protein FerR (iron transport regulator)